jgi:hypothetical protein
MRSSLICAVAVLVSVATISLPATTQSETRAKQPTASAKQAPARKRFSDYQVPAGTTLPIELRSRLNSNSSQLSDIVEGRLLRTLTTPEGVELVPAGAPVLGSVREVEPAGVKKPGHLAFTFHVVEHPETGSRATIKAAVLRFASQPPVKGNLFADVQLEKGMDASVLLLAPLVVRIPTN